MNSLQMNEFGFSLNIQRKYSLGTILSIAFLRRLFRYSVRSIVRMSIETNPRERQIFEGLVHAVQAFIHQYVFIAVFAYMILETGSDAQVDEFLAGN